MTLNQGQTPGYYISSNFQQNYRNGYGQHGVPASITSPNNGLNHIKNSPYHSNLNQGRHETVNHQNIVQQPRPYFQKRFSNIREPKQSFHNVAGNTHQQPKKSICCSPIVLIVVGLIALIGIVLGVIFGINNISGDQVSGNKQSVDKHNFKYRKPEFLHLRREEVNDYNSMKFNYA